MARYRDPKAPEGRVVFGGEAFHDGVTADINPGQETLLLFKSAGITAVPGETPTPGSGTVPATDATTDPGSVTEPAEGETPPSATRKRK